MSGYIQRLETWFEDNRPSFLEVMNVGARAESLNSFEAAQGIRMPEELRAFYLWRNGQPVGSTTFFGNKSLMPLKDVAHVLSVLNSLRDGGEFESPNWWSPAWIPFVADGGGNYVVVDTEKNGEIREFWKADSDRDVIAGSFGEWLDNRIEEFEAENWVEYEGAYIPANDVAVQQAWDKVDLVLTSAPAGGLGALKELKAGLNIDVGIGLLLKGSRNPPFVLQSSQYYTTIRNQVARLANDALVDCLTIYPEGDHSRPLPL